MKVKAFFATRVPGVVLLASESEIPTDGFNPKPAAEFPDKYSAHNWAQQCKFTITTPILTNEYDER